MQVSQARNHYAWQQAYQDALFEFDRTRLRPKLEGALKAVQDRLFEVRFHPADRSEVMQLQDAKHKIKTRNTRLCCSRNSKVCKP